MTEELKKQQNRIEEKLDLILSVLSGHPEFGEMVKKGKRKAFYEAKREELQKKLEEWKSAKQDVMLEAIRGGRAPDLEGALTTPDIMIRPRNEASERQSKIFSEAFENTELYPILLGYLNTRIGPEPNVESELNKLMNEYDEKQENI
jgi:hypothetical protein